MTTLSYSYTLTNGTVADATQVMSNFTAISSILNGQIDSSNINAGASITWTGTETFAAGLLKIKGAGSGTVSFQNINTSNSRTLTIPDPLTDDTFVTFTLQSQGSYNLGFNQGADSSQLKITSANGTALSASNPAYIRMRGFSTATFQTFSMTADVTIDLTGAHWGLDTKGDVTAAILRVYAINDNGTLKWGVGYQGGFEFIRNTQDDTVAANIDLPEEFLVNSNVATDASPVRDVGYIFANFTDATNEWAINGYFANQSADGLWQACNTSFTGFSANPTALANKFTTIGKTVYWWQLNGTAGTSNAATYTQTLPIKSKNGGTVGLCAVTDNSAIQTAPGRYDLNSASTTITFGKALTAAAGFTAVGTKFANVFVMYEAYQP